MSLCICCDQVFTYNPMRVPSTTALTGEREPICRDCVNRANPERIKNGLEPIKILPGAYEGCPEEELDWG